MSPITRSSVSVRLGVLLLLVFVVTKSSCYSIYRRLQSERQYCPIPGRWNDSTGGVGESGEDGIERRQSLLKVIDLSKTEGKKVRIQFYTPHPSRANFEREEKPRLPGDLPQATLAFPYFVDDTSGGSRRKGRRKVIPIKIVPVTSTLEDTTEVTGWRTETAAGTTTASPSSPPIVTVTGDPHPALISTVSSADTTRTTDQRRDAPTTARPQILGEVLCQWEFQAANESEYLLLTFNNLSAPYSTDCADAYVALQKDNGYESRWCGNRRQVNSRPMSLFSKTSAKITVFRRSTSPQFPPTGFSVTVESLDIYAISGIENSLRVLLG